jgi:multicomponent Na+:H+ antiporter subunit G
VILDALAVVLLGAGLFFHGVAALGVLRMPDFYTRLHAASLTDSMGTILVLAGVALQAGWSLAGLKLVAILVFLLLTSPTATYALANAAHFAGLRPLLAAGDAGVEAGRSERAP